VAEGRLLVFATKGAGSNDETRILELLADHDLDRFAFDRASKRRNVPALLRHAHRTRPALIVMEGTGLAGGAVVLLARMLLGIPFVVSSGDAVGPFLAGTRPVLAAPAWLYERLLYRLGAGFIGWTPYLVGRAITLGARRGVTAASWTQLPELASGRDEVRDGLGIPRDAVVYGIVGSLDWNAHKGYCYGLELVRAVRRSGREDVAVLVVGGGSGLERLRAEAGDDLGRRVFLPGPVEQRLVTAHLAAIDVGSLPQTLDAVGALRYTTKISEYISARLPIATGRLPLAYDLADAWSWRLPGDTPWSEAYVSALADLMDRLSPADVAAARERVPPELATFDRGDQRRRVAAFVAELLADSR
jgi:hypothetical protein